MREIAAKSTDVAVGFCLDTCHLLAAGFDITTQGGLRSMLKKAEATLGLDNVRVIHANDSKCPLGSNTDRHAHIGEGHIGREAFHRILTCRALRDKPFILETPVDQDGDDRRNLDTLKSLARRNGFTSRTAR
jgi:deoxyribonuclease-4